MLVFHFRQLKMKHSPDVKLRDPNEVIPIYSGFLVADLAPEFAAVFVLRLMPAMYAEGKPSKTDASGSASGHQPASCPAEVRDSAGRITNSH